MTMNTIRARAIAGSLALFASVGTIAAGSPAQAETVHARVAYGDLDLASDAGRDTLDRRLRNAAEAVCGPLTPSSRFDVQDCRRQAYARAKANVAMANIAGVRTASLR